MTYLFVLDMSVTDAEFHRMTGALSFLVALFCKPIKVAAMTFDHQFYIEFCFDCFAAIDCVCSTLLKPICGLDPDATCIDIVFITDGKSNDPSRDVCDEARSNMLCIHNKLSCSALLMTTLKRENFTFSTLLCLMIFLLHLIKPWKG